MNSIILHNSRGRLYVKKGKYCVQKQLVINKLSIPDELIRIIKDYVFLDEVQFIQYELHKEITGTLNNIIRLEQYYVDSSENRVQCGVVLSHEDTPYIINIQHIFCLHCGECIDFPCDEKYCGIPEKMENIRNRWYKPATDQFVNIYDDYSESLYETEHESMVDDYEEMNDKEDDYDDHDEHYGEHDDYDYYNEYDDYTGEESDSEYVREQFIRAYCHTHTNTYSKK